MDLLSPNIDTLCIDTVRWLADRFNRPGFKIVDHRTYAFSEDVGKRYEAYGWRVIRVADGEDLQALTQAFEEAARPCGKPTLISCRTIIGFPAPTRQNTAGAHGAPLGEPEISATKEILGFDPDGHFVVPAAAQDEWRKCETRGAGAETAWNALFERYRQAYPVLAAEFEAMMKGELVPDWESILPTFQPGEKYATREAGGKAINALAARTALEAEGIPTRVVSMPSWEIFQAQPAEYRQQVLPAAVAARVSIEAGVTLGWERWLGKGGAAIGLGSFGCSGPAETLFEQFGFTGEGLKATHAFKAEGIKTNVTLCFSATQGLMAAKAGATYVSPFVGRLDDINAVGMELIRELVEIFANHGLPTHVLAASIRSPRHVTDAALAGAQVATIPTKVFDQMLAHPLTDRGIEGFLADWKKSGR